MLSDRVLRMKSNRERTPDQFRKWFKKPRDYEGSVSTTAEPGKIIPRVQRDAAVMCDALWCSDPYLDTTGRSRIDVAFGLGIGELSGIIRLVAGNDRLPIYNNSDIEEVTIGQRFFKSIEFFEGTETQEQSSIIKKHLGEDDTPYYPGLSYFVLKGFKLWKWPNRSVPVIRAVVLRNLDDISADTYDETVYDSATGEDVTSLTGDSDYVYVTCSGCNIFKVELSTNTWTDLGTGGNTSCGNNCLGIMNGDLYYLHYNDLMIYSGSGTTWNVAVNTAYLSDRLAVKPDGTKMMYRAGWSGATKIYTYDGVTVTDEGYPSDYVNMSTTHIANDGTLYVLAYTSSSNAIIRRKLSGGSWQQTVAQTDDYRSVNGLLIDPDNGWMHLTKYGPDLDFYHQKEPFSVSTPPAGSENLIIADSVNRVSDIEYFSKRYHFCRNIAGVNKIFREESNGTITQLPTPAAGTFTRTLILQKIGNALYCGTNDGFYRV